MNEELKQALAELKTDIESKSAQEIKAEVSAFETKFADLIAEQTKSVKSELEAQIKAVQDHANTLDAELQKKSVDVADAKDPLKSMISENFEDIKVVRKGKSVKLESKAVGDMTLANLTGDQPRVYSQNVAGVPSQALNFSDLVTAIPIDGGTYTFPRETTSEGAIAAQTEGSAKSQIDYDLAMIDVNTDFIAGFAVYSKKMANNLPFLENYLPQALRRDYFKVENSTFYTALSGAATASALTSGNIVERIVNEQVTLLALNYTPNAIVVSPADYGSILLTAGTSGTGSYSLPGVVQIVNGNVTINGITVFVASWMPSDKYIIGDWSMANKIVTQGLGVEFFEQDSDNVRKNNITARVESQVALAVYRPDAFIFGDFTTVA